MTAKNMGRWSFAVGISGLIWVIVYISVTLTHHDTALFLVVAGLVAGLLVCLGALIEWKERKLKGAKK